MQLANFQAYKAAKYKALPDTQAAWLLTGKCQSRPGMGRDYSNLRLDSQFPVEYLHGQEIQPDQVMVRFDAVGACASDIKIAAQGGDHPRMKGRDLDTFPAIMGHEVALTVVSVGEALRDRYHPGERYVVNAETILDGKKVTFGYKLWGGYRQFGVYGRMLLDNDDGCSLRTIPDDMGYLLAASLEPYACCFNTLNRHRPELKTLRAQGNAWIMGAGPMARFLMESILSREHSCPAKIAVTEVRNDRLDRFRLTVGRRAEQAGIQMAYVDANDTGKMFADVKAFIPEVDDAFLMFAAPQSVMQPLVTGALGMMNDGGVFDIFAGLKDEVIVAYGDHELPLKALHYGSRAMLDRCVRVEGFSGLEGANLDEARDAISAGSIHPYETSIAAVASLDSLPEVLRAIEGASIDGKCIVLPHAASTLGFRAIDELAAVLDFEAYRGSGIDVDDARQQMERGRMSDAATMILFDQLVRC